MLRNYVSSNYYKFVSIVDYIQITRFAVRLRSKPLNGAQSVYITDYIF